MSNFIFCTTLIFFVIQSGGATFTGRHGDTGECKTTGSADSLFSVVDPHKPYVFMSLEQYVPSFTVARAFLQGQPGASASLEISEILGLAAVVKGRAYFFNVAGCPNVVYVPNNNSTVYGYANLYGSQIYQAFRAITSKCDFQCNACSISAVNADQNIVSYTAGKHSITFGNIQSYSMVPVDGIPPASLSEKIHSVLKQNPVQNYSLQSCEQCVNINSKYPFLLSCPVVNKAFQSLPLTNSIDNPVYQQKDQFCSYVIGQSQVLNKTPQRILTLYRFLIPSTVCNSFAVITCYSTNQLFDYLAQVVITSCG